MGLFERKHAGKGKEIRAEQWTCTCILGIENIDIIWTNIVISIVVQQIETKLQLLPMSF